MRPLLMTLLLVLGLVVSVDAGVYYNSSEPGCTGSDPNVLMCEDFEKKADGSTPGNWYTTDCDHGGWVAGNKGWCSSIYANPITPPGAVLCGSGVTPFGLCAGNGGAKSGQGGRNMALHHFKTATCGNTGTERCGVGEVYVRWYAKWLAPYQFGAEKHMNITNSDGDIAFTNVQLNCGAGGASSSATPYVQVLHGMDICQAPNQSSISIQAGRWYFFEMHVRAGSSGLIELWINDCGTEGTACGAAPVLRTRLAGNLPGNANGSQIETVWLENWANPASNGTGPLWDNLKVSRVGPIGFSGAQAPPTPTFTLAATAVGAGAVTGAGSYPANTTVTPVASAAAGSTFTGWSGDCSGTGACSVVMNANRAVTATFTTTTTPPPVGLPGMPGSPSVVLASVDTVGASYNVAWAPGSGATSYSYTAGAGSAYQQGAVTPPSLLLKLPYMSNGLAGSGFVCITSVNAAGSSAEASCNAVPIPARVATPPPTGTLAVSQTASRCLFVLTSTPPDTTGGWTVRYLQGGTVVTSPVELTKGTYTFTAQWTKAGQTTRTPAAVTSACP